MMRASSVILLATLVGSGVLMPNEAAAKKPLCQRGVCSDASTDGTDFVAEGTNEETATTPAQPASGPVPQVSTVTRTQYVAACSGNTVSNAFDNICANAVSCADPLATRYWIYQQTTTTDRRQTPPEVTVGPWRMTDERCEARNDGPTLGAVQAIVRTEFVSKRPALPQLVVRPAPRVLISAQNAFSAGSREPVELVDTVLGLPIVITATPRRWVWDFGDGQTVTTTSPGRPGTPEVAHAYDRVGPMSVTVTVEWSGTFRIGGIAGEFPIDGVARVASAPVVLQSVAARTELVDQ